MTNREAISRAKIPFKEVRADSLLTNKYIYSALYTSASLIIKRDADNKRSVYALSNIWTPYCVEMEYADAVTCPIEIPTNCRIMRSKTRLPEFLETAGGFLYKSIGSADVLSQNSFVLVTPYQYSLKSKIKYNKTKYVFIEDGYLYAPNCDYPTLKVLGYFKKAITTNCKDCGASCSILDATFPAPDYLFDTILKMALQEIGVYKSVQHDNVNNKNESNTIM
jgi:hypothetical protein